MYAEIKHQVLMFKSHSLYFSYWHHLTSKTANHTLAR